MSDTQATFFATVIDEWVRGGVTDAVVAPGNRSTLLSALLVQDGRIRVHVIIDERSAAFFALGLGIATGRPAVFWCTSGTAAAEAHAAVIEADQGASPLLVCTADRPPELHHVRDWQSVDQQHLYGRSPRWYFDPGVAVDAARSSWRSMAARSVVETTQHPLGPGPVHLNFPIREPWALDVGELPVGRPDDAPWHVTIPRSFAIEDQQIAPFLRLTAKRGIIVAGGGDLDPAAVHGLAESIGWPVLSEARSGCRVPRDTTIALSDELVRFSAFANGLRPDVVLRLGTPTLSKPLTQWIKSSGATEFVVDPHDNWVGSLVDASTVIPVDGSAFCRAVLDRSPDCADSPWLEQWRSADNVARKAVQTLMGGGELTEPAVAYTVAAKAPDSSIVFAATSMPVRDIESYAPVRDGLRVLANRGASGMDGIVSTAAGVACGSEVPVTLLIGDLTFLYDLNAQWALGGVDGSMNLTVVIIDNNGGGIFSLLPQLEGVSSEVFERVVATPQTVNIQAVIRAFDIPCEEIDSISALATAVSRPTGNRRVLYLRSDRNANARAHQSIHFAVSTALETFRPEP